MKNVTMTGNFRDLDQATAARRDMAANGIAEDRIFIDEDQKTIRVIIPEDQTPQIREAFGKHGIAPTQ